jgi:hypothetical protein
LVEVEVIRLEDAVEVEVTLIGLEDERCLLIITAAEVQVVGLEVTPSGCVVRLEDDRHPSGLAKLHVPSPPARTSEHLGGRGPRSRASRSAVEEGRPLDLLKKASLRKTSSYDFLVVTIGRVLPLGTVKEGARCPRAFEMSKWRKS